MSAFDNTFQAKQYTNAVTSTIRTIVVVREIWIIKHNFGGGHLGFQDGRHAKRMFLYSSPMGLNRHTSGCTYIVGVENKYGSSHQLFCGGHFKIQDYRHIGSNHQRVVIGRYAVRIDSLYE